MKVNKKLTLLSLGVSALVTMTSVAHAQPSARMLADACAACHGPNGSTVGPATPTIAGMTEEYLKDSMMGYKSGERKATVMNRIAKGYTDGEIAAMAKYFAAKPFVRVRQNHDATAVATGKRLHAKYCENCHEEQGRKADGISVVAGQMIPYMRDAIVDFKSGDRLMEKRKRQKMQKLMDEAGDAGVTAVLQYYGSQK